MLPNYEKETPTPKTLNRKTFRDGGMLLTALASSCEAEILGNSRTEICKGMLLPRPPGGSRK